MLQRVLGAIVTVAVLTSIACSDDSAPPDDSLGTTSPSAASATSRSPAPTPSPTLTPSFLDPRQVTPLSLDAVFPPRDISALRLDPSRLRTLIATGDVIPARFVDVTIRRQGDDFLYPVSATRDIVSNADLTAINLEAPLIQDCPYHDSGFTFCGRPGFVAALQAAGVDVATLENNHISNYGSQGVEETLQRLQSAGIATADRDEPAVLDVRGLKFGFLAFNGVGEYIDRDRMAAEIRELRPRVGVLVVAFHWGKEYVSVPDTTDGVAPDDPLEIAHLAIESGADLIIGNHPHWVQGVEIYKGKFVTYAHGNFIFDQMWSYETRLGVIGRYTFYDNALVRVEFTPMLIENYARPVPMQGSDGQAVLDIMRAASLEIARRAEAAAAR